MYDVAKCFDSLWVQECINDMFDAGIQNDKLNLLHLLNENAQVAAKTSSGLTERKDIPNIIMQGTVWGGMFCTTTMDKLGKYKYENPDMLYMYKNKVGVPALEMVDDILDVQKCGVDAIKSNALINTFIEHKKMSMGHEKCERIHCGKKTSSCPDLMVPDQPMHSSGEVTYLGDQVTSSANNVKTISKRKAKGYGIISDIMFLLEAIPNGRHRTKVGLELRQAWFLNSVLLNMETWHNLQDNHLKELMTLDNYLIRQIIGAHSKVPVEFLFLETSAIPINFVLTSRRLNYLHIILNRSDEELTKQIYTAQKLDPIKGDWAQNVGEDMKKVDLNMEEGQIMKMKKSAFKNIVRRKVKSAAFSSLKVTQSSHIKINKINYNSFSTQTYLNSQEISFEESSTLFNIRANTVNGFKTCFPSIYRNNLNCKLGCKDSPDSIEHCMNCSVLDNHIGICHEPISLVFEALDKQILAVRKFISRNNTRAALLEGSQSLPGPGDTGHEHAGPAGGAGERSGPPQP